MGGDYIERRGDVTSRDYKIEDNVFINHPLTLDISASDRVALLQNAFANFDKLLTGEEPNPEFSFSENKVFQINNWGDAIFYRFGNTIKNNLTKEDSITLQENLQSQDLKRQTSVPPCRIPDL